MRVSPQARCHGATAFLKIFVIVLAAFVHNNCGVVRMRLFVPRVHETETGVLGLSLSEVLKRAN